MIRIVSVFLIFTTLLLAQAQKSESISKFEIRDGKKVYFPIKKEPVSSTISAQVVKADVITPVIKGFYVEYKKN